MTEFTTEKFSGPLGLLLSLIESEKLDITEVNLAKIADDYVAYVRGAENIDPEELADFLVLAAKLLYIKSKALLPYLQIEEEEDDAGELEKQLRMYKEFILAGERLKEIIAQEKFLFLPPLLKNRRVQNVEPSFSPPLKLNADILAKQFLYLLEAWEKQKEKLLPEERLESKISIEDKIAGIRKLLLDKIKVNFSRLLRESVDRTEIIVSFLAVLELAKQKELIFEQSELFSEIHILNSHN